MLLAANVGKFLRTKRVREGLIHIARLLFGFERIIPVFAAKYKRVVPFHAHL